MTLTARFGGIYRVNAMSYGQTATSGPTSVNTEDLPEAAPLGTSPEASYWDNPQLVGWRQLFLALQRLGAEGMAKGAFAWLDDPASRVYSPEDLAGPYLYSRRHYFVVDDAFGADFTRYMQTVEGPSFLAAQADLRAIRQGRLQKAPPGYGTRLRLSEGYFKALPPKSIPVTIRLSSNNSVTVTPLVENRQPFVLEA